MLRREALLLLLGLLVETLGEILTDELDPIIGLLLRFLLLRREAGVGLFEALRIGGLVLGHLALASPQSLLAGGLVPLELQGMLLAPRSLRSTNHVVLRSSYKIKSNTT